MADACLWFGEDALSAYAVSPPRLNKGPHATLSFLSSLSSGIDDEQSGAFLVRPTNLAALRRILFYCTELPKELGFLPAA